SGDRGPTASTTPKVAKPALAPHLARPRVDSRSLVIRVCYTCRDRAGERGRSITEAHQMNRRWLGLAFVLAAGGIAWWWQSHQAQLTPNKTSADRQFTELDAALAAGAPGWKLHIPPPHPGPYRLLPETSVVVGDAKSGAICRVRDTSGAV